MPDFQPNVGGDSIPFGRNEPFRSTKGIREESYTFSKDLIPTVTIDGFAQKVLQPGTILAKATSGPQAGKVGVFMAGVTDGRQTAANIVGVNKTFAPWQLMERDIEVAAVYSASMLQARCIEYNTSGVAIPLTNTTRDAIKALADFNTLLFR